jgi:hypothetical protein
MATLLEAVDAPLVWRLLLGAITAYTCSHLFPWLWKGISIRREVRALRAQGVPTLEHSWIWGHLPIFGQFRKENPGDIAVYQFHKWILDNASRLFPGQDSPPAVFHVDTWPFSTPLLVVTDPIVASSFTQVTSLPKSTSTAWFTKPLTGGVDLVATDGHQWKTWRSRLNPGFSVRNITALMPELVEEVMVFLNVLKGHTGQDGQWGPVFQLEKATTNLTMDVIVRATL